MKRFIYITIFVFSFISIQLTYALPQDKTDSLSQVNEEYKAILFNDSNFLDMLFYKHFNNVLINNLGTYGSSHYFPTTYLVDNQEYVFAPKKINETLLKLDGFRPFTNLTWINAGRREQILSLQHIQKFGKLASLQFQYRRISAPGIYINQETNQNLFNGAFNFNTDNKVYQLEINTHIDRVRNQENGGLTDINHFEKDTFNRRSLYQVNIDKSYYEIKETNFGINQRFNFLNNEIDSNQYQRFYLQLNNHYKTWRRMYYDYDAGSPIYQNTYFDSTSTFWLDSIYHKEFTHSLSLGMTTSLMDVSGLFEIHQNRYTQLTGIDTFYNTSYAGVKADFYLQKAKIQSQVKYGLNGYNKGDVQSFLNVQLYPSKNYLINLKASYNLIEPALNYKNYSSNHFKWDSTNLLKQQTIYLSTDAYSKALKLRFFANAKFLDRFFYYDSLVVLKQHDFASNQISLGLEKDYRLWKFHFKTAFIYQLTSDEVLLPVPNIVARQIVYYENRLFKKVLKLRTGFNASYTSEFYGYEFMPGISQFYVQDKKKIGNYPYIDFFISLHLKRAQIFFKWEHVNAGMMNYNYFLTPTIPDHDRSFKFGVNWNMFD